MTRRIVCTAILIGMLAVSGCAASPGGQTLPNDLFKAARQSEKAPKGFHDGLHRKSCGGVTLDQGARIPAEAVACIVSGIGTMDSELAVVSLTTEGDPIVAFYRTAVNTPGVEKFTDGEFDRFGPKTWTHETCPETTTLSSPQGCSEI